METFSTSHSNSALVPGVHPQRHVRLPAVAAEMALADQQADQDPGGEEWSSGSSDMLFHRKVTRETEAGFPLVQWASGGRLAQSVRAPL